MNVAILAGEGYEDLELWYPKLRFTEEDFDVKIAASDKEIKKSKHGYEVLPDVKSDELRAEDFDCVIIPGGIKGAENLRMDKAIVRFVKEMERKGKVVGSICHGAWVLISAYIVKDRKITCYEGMKDDLIAARARYVDEEVTLDDNIVTSRKPSDLPQFVKKILEKLR